MSDGEAQLRRQVPFSLLRLAGPMIALMISRTIMGFIDFWMVGDLDNGSLAQAAIIPAGITLWLFIGFGEGLVSSVITMVSQSFGRKRMADCSAYGWQGLYLSLAMAVMFLPIWFGLPHFFQIVGHEPHVQVLEVAYAQVAVLWIGPTVASAVLGGVFNGVHRSGVILMAGVVANAVNILANYLLIFGHWGFPALGIAGAAWGTLSAITLQSGILLIWMLRSPFAAQFASRRTWRLNLVKFRAMLRLGWPVALWYSLDIFCWTVFIMWLIGRYGTNQLAASNVCMKFLEFSFMPILGLCMALTSVVGRAIGEGRKDLARLNVRWAIGFVSLFSVTVAVLLLTLRYPLTGILSDDETVRQLAARFMIFGALFQIFDVVALVYRAALRGAGDNVWVSVVSLAYAAVFLVGGGMAMGFLVPDWKGYGPWAAATVFVIILAVTTWARFVYGPWEQIDLMGDSDSRAGPV